MWLLLQLDCMEPEMEHIIPSNAVSVNATHFPSRVVTLLAVHIAATHLYHIE